jgi:ferrous iron transport protein A
MNSTRTARLGELSRGQGGKIVSVAGNSEELVQRLLAMGLLEGSNVEVVHEAPFGGDPVAVRVRGALLALRRSEANYITVSLLLNNSEPSAQPGHDEGCDHE